jgi:hypothetical protein
VKEPVAWLVYAKGSRKYFTLTFDLNKVPEIYIGGEALPLYTTPPAQPAPVQEPVHQWRQKHSPYWYDGYPDNDDGGGPYETRTLYTTPPAAQRQWVGLTDEEILKLAYPIRWQEVDDFEADKAVNFAQAIEAKLKEKNT